MARTAPIKSQFIAAIVREFTEQVQYQEIPLPEEYESMIEVVCFAYVSSINKQQI